MSKTVLMVGTRKGCFLLESDESRRDWEVRGPFCEGWPIYHAVRDAGTGAIYAAAASEWHGASIWRSPDLGETWNQSSEGLNYGEGELKLSKVSGLTVANGRLFAGAEMPGVFESSDGGETWSLLSTLEGQPGSEGWNDPANQPPGHLGVPAILQHPDDASRYWAIVQGVGIFETTDDGSSWTPRNKGLRADWPIENPEVGYCVHKLVMSPVDTRPPLPAEPRRHAPQRRRGPLVDRDHRRPADGVRLRRRRAPARSRHVLRHPARPRPRALHARRRRGGVAYSRRGLELGTGSRTACRRATPMSACCARGWRSTRTTSPGSTSARARVSSSPAPTRARAGARSRATCRGSCPSKSQSSTSRGRGPPPVDARRLSSPACRAGSRSTPAPSTEALDRLEEQWPGFRDRLCEPGPALRRHIHVYVDRQRADLDTALEPRSRVDVIAAISGG